MHARLSRPSCECLPIALDGVPRKRAPLTCRTTRSRSAKPEKGAILEMCYNPRVWTDICTVSKEQGWDVVTGELAMIWQGIEQQKIWLNATTEELPVQETVDLVSKQVKSDTETGAAPPQS